MEGRPQNGPHAPDLFLNALTNLTRVTKVSEWPAMVPVTCQQPGAGHSRPLGVKPKSPYPPGTWPWKPGAPFTAIEFEGMTVTPYVDTGRCQGKGRCGARQGYSLKATSVRAPSRGTARPLPARPL